MISFRDSGNETLSTSYHKDLSLSYYKQCFEELGMLGEGSFGEVYKVRSKDDGKFYAVKKSKQHFKSEASRREKLEEIKRYEEFANDKHCITLHNAWEEDDRLYMLFELCKGSVDQWASEIASQNQCVSENEVWSFLLDLLLALKSLHDKNLVHLDVKLENVLITNENVCKLADFGLVYDLTQNSSSAVEGDSRYIAPEVLRGHFSTAADVFSLGVCCLELACGLELSANGPLWQNLRQGVLPDEFLRTLSNEMQQLIRSMMHPNPLQRPSVDTLLSHPTLVGLRQKRKRVWLRLCAVSIYFNFL